MNSHDMLVGAEASVQAYDGLGCVLKGCKANKCRWLHLERALPDR